MNSHVVGSVFIKKYGRKIECIYLLKLSFDSLYFSFISMVLSKNLYFSQRVAYTIVLKDSKKSVKRVVSHVHKQKWQRPEYHYFDL